MEDKRKRRDQLFGNYDLESYGPHSERLLVIARPA